MTVTKDIIDFKKSLVKDNLFGLALDIDETLSNTAETWLKDFFEKHGNPENLTPLQFIKKYLYIENAPYFQTPVVKKMLDDFCQSPLAYENLGLMENCKEVVNQINQIIPIAAYITMRPAAVLESTQKWLKKNNFPNAPIITRPNNLPREQSTSWKATVLEELYPNIIGIVDDNHSFIEKLSHGYKGKIFLYNNTRQIDRTDLNIISCPTWDCVLAKIHS